LDENKNNRPQAKKEKRAQQSRELSVVKSLEVNAIPRKTKAAACRKAQNGFNLVRSEIKKTGGG